MESTAQELKNRQRLIDKNSKKLQKKYYRTKSTVSEGFLEESQSTFAKVASIIFTIITIMTTLFTSVLCIATIMSAYYGATPTFFGYSTMQVASGSMSKESITIDGVEYPSGYEIGDHITIRAVDTSTLKPGDAIAFYAYSPNYVKFHSVSKEEITVDQNMETKYNITFAKFFGFQTAEIYDAASNGGMLTFHHVTNVFRDYNGKLWFKTQGSSNSAKDPWYISEEMVVGILQPRSQDSFGYKFINLVSTRWGFILLLLVPIGLLLFTLLYTFIKDLYLAFLELDVVEEKRKLTDEICVKNKIGFRMDNKTKYKVLSQANEDEEDKYISLLWKDTGSQDFLRKYIKRKKHVIRLNKRLLEVNRQCEAMLEEGKPMREIAEYYTEQKLLIQKDKSDINERIKKIHKNITKQKKESKKANV